VHGLTLTFATWHDNDIQANWACAMTLAQYIGK